MTINGNVMSCAIIIWLSPDLENHILNKFKFRYIEVKVTVIIHIFFLSQLLTGSFRIHLASNFVYSYPSIYIFVHLFVCPLCISPFMYRFGSNLQERSVVVMSYKWLIYDVIERVGLGNREGLGLGEGYDQHYG